MKGNNETSSKSGDDHCIEEETSMSVVSTVTTQRGSDMVIKGHCTDD